MVSNETWMRWLSYVYKELFKKLKPFLNHKLNAWPNAGVKRGFDIIGGQNDAHIGTRFLEHPGPQDQKNVQLFKFKGKREQIKDMDAPEWSSTGDVVGPSPIQM